MALLRSSENKISRSKSPSRNLSHRIKEITGAPGSGKTTFIRKHFPDHALFIGGWPASCGPAKRVFPFIPVFCFAIAAKRIGIRQTLWLLKKAVNYDETLFARINAFRNCIMKFGHNFFNKNHKPILIDEGVSHIPFVLGLEDEDMDIFIMLFRRQLENTDIIFIQSPPKEILIKRIVERGHKRVREATDAKSFVERNITISENYKRSLLASGLDVTFIYNESLLSS